MVLWCVLALLLVRGGATCLLRRGAARREPGSRPVRRRGRMIAARAFAADFARAYLSWSPRHPDEYARGVARVRLAGARRAVVPQFARRGSAPGGAGRWSRATGRSTRAARWSRWRRRWRRAAPSTRYWRCRWRATRAAAWSSMTCRRSWRRRRGRGQPEPSSSRCRRRSERQIEDVLARFFAAFLAGAPAIWSTSCLRACGSGRSAQRYELAGWTRVGAAAPAAGAAGGAGGGAGPRPAAQAVYRAALPGAAGASGSLVRGGSQHDPEGGVKGCARSRAMR